MSKNKIEPIINKYLNAESDHKKQKYAKKIAANIEDNLYGDEISKLPIDDIIYIINQKELSVLGCLFLLDIKTEFSDQLKILSALHFNEEVSLDDSFKILEKIKDNGAFKPLRDLEKKYNELKNKSENYKSDLQKSAAKTRAYKEMFLDEAKVKKELEAKVSEADKFKQQVNHDIQVVATRNSILEGRVKELEDANLRLQQGINAIKSNLNRL